MRTLPPEPNPGDRISANMIRELIRAIRERTPIPGPGVKVSTGPNGSIISSNTGSSGKPEKTKDHGRFNILSIEIDDDEATVKIGNQYYRCGGRTYSAGEESEVTVSEDEIIALKVDISDSNPSAVLTTYASLSSMRGDENDEKYYIMPLYKFGSSFAVECDFRIGPDAAQFEFAQ